MLHHIDDIDYTKFLKLAEGGQTRGHTLVKLVKQGTASRLRQCVLGICVVNDWNSRDEAVVIAESVHNFKTGLEHPGKRRILNTTQLGTMACHVLMHGT